MVLWSRLDADCATVGGVLVETGRSPRPLLPFEVLFPFLELGSETPAGVRQAQGPGASLVPLGSLLPPLALSGLGGDVYF